jgi:hypothetical protein
MGVNFDSRSGIYRLFTKLMSEQSSVAVNLQARIRKVWGSNIGYNTGYAEAVCDFTQFTQANGEIRVRNASIASRKLLFKYVPNF